MQHPRPEPRRRDPGLMALLKVQADCCEITGVTRNLHLHHVVFRSQGGDDMRANIICMSGDLHERYHRSDAEARLRVAEYIVKQRPDVLSYLCMKLGHTHRDLWLEQHGLRQWRATNS